jgi:hypothetical protein
MSTKRPQLDEPLQSVADEIGLNELRRRLNPRRFEHVAGPHDHFCPECNAAITVTQSVGEAGHRDTCPIRDERYTGATENREGEN